MLPTWQDIPILIISRDRVSPMQEMVSWLVTAGYRRIVVVDNASTYPPLLSYLESAPVEVVSLQDNGGPTVPWTTGLFARLGIEGPFVLTDGDIVPDDGCPTAVVARLLELLVRHADVDKAGVGLRIDDLPDAYGLKNEVVAWESAFWEDELEPGVFRADVDTTFALYRSPASPPASARCLRTGAPYVMRHLPWYADSRQPSEEERYYRENADQQLSHWDGGELDDGLRQLMAIRDAQRRTPAVGSTQPLLGPWSSEPEVVDESSFTPWAEPGWHAWNDMSPELETCELAALLAQFAGPGLVVETGVGQGYATRRISARIGPHASLLAFETDESIRAGLVQLPFFGDPRIRLSEASTPAAEDFALARLCILDSEIPTRLGEIDRWCANAPAGCLLLVHDTGNGHGPETPHHQVRARLQERRVAGMFLNNPRGSFIGVRQ